MFDLKHTTVGAQFTQTAQLYPERPAVEYLGKVLRYRELDAMTDRLARGLLARGIGKGTRVGIWGNNRPGTLACYLALEKIGAVPAMLSTSLREQELLPLLAQADLRYLFFDEGFRETSFPEVCRRVAMPGIEGYLYMALGQQRALRRSATCSTTLMPSPPPRWPQRATRCSRRMTT